MTASGPWPVVGIDLGTTNSVASVSGRPVELGVDAEGGVVLPSVVAFPPSGARLVGAAARRRRVIDVENTLFSTKRVIGRRWESPEAVEFRRRYPFVMQRASTDAIEIMTRAGCFTPVDVAALLIGRMLASVPHPVPRDNVAIAVPASFGPAQREATEAAARQAGARSVTIVDEPLAAAAAYADLLRGGLAVVFDLGGGTFDFSVLDCSVRPFRVVASDGDPFLGGDDVDHALAQWAVIEIIKRHNVDLRVDREAFERLIGACEAAKIHLSYEETAAVDLMQVDPVMLPEDARVDIDRAQLAKIAADLVRRTFIVCEDVLRRAGVSRTDIGEVVLAGGSTQLPQVRSGLERFFGRPARVDISPTQVVAIGTSTASVVRR